jgi:hypothetical protein
MEPITMHKRAAFLLFLAFACTGPAHAQRMYKCMDAKGKVYYTQVPPSECLGRETQELSKSGVVVRRNEAPLSPEQLAAREADKVKKAADEERAKEERRKNAALLNTYASERDIEEARARSLKDNEDQIKQTEKRIADALKRQKELASEKEFYTRKSPPAKLAQDMDNNKLELATQQESLEARRKQVSSLNAKYDQDKLRYLELTKGYTAPVTPAAAPSRK